MDRDRTQLPSGTVSFLFTDIEGSTRRWEANPTQMRDALRTHDRVLQATIREHDGHVFKTIGDAFCAAFGRTEDAVAAACEINRALAREDFAAVDGLCVRSAVHVGTADERDGDYFGAAVNRVARLLAVGHGGQILLSGVAAEVARHALRDDIALRDLGAHRLKDLTTAEQIFQVIASDLLATHPPLRSLSTHRNNLPHQLTSLVGRDALLTELAARSEATRLLTLVGAGGVGKTRLAIQLGADTLERFPDGVWFVELAALTSDERLIDHLAREIDVPIATNVTARESVLTALRARKTLLILNNCEHLIASVAELAHAIVIACPNVRIVATSREPLDISGESVHRVESLRYPGASDLVTAKNALDFGAIALLVERMRAVTDRLVVDDESAPILGEIARRLDGIPLALELAAPKIVVLTLREITNRLNERFRLLSSNSRTALPRQQTMRAMIDWSYELLAPNERLLFARLAIFTDGWTLAAASEICSDERIDAWDVFELLASLVRKSLVVADIAGGNDRYHFLESTREYARERLLASGEADDLALRHARAFARFVREAGALWDAMEDRAWRRAIAGDIENLRAAFDWAIARPETARIAIELLVDIRQARLVVNLPESLRRIAVALRCVDETDLHLLAGLRAKEAALVVYAGVSVEEFVGAAERALASAREAGDDGLIARTTMTLAIALRAAGDLERADAILMQLAKEIDAARFPRSAIELQSDWAVIALLRGDFAVARERLTGALRGAKSGSLVHATTLAMLAEVEAVMGDLAPARTSARLAKVEFDELGSRLNVGVISNNLAAYAIAVDDYDEAFELLAEALAILRDYGSRTFLLQSIEHHALLAALLNERETAMHLFGYSDHHFGKIGAPRAGVDLQGYERLVTLLGSEFDAEVRERALRHGAELDEDTVLDYARSLHQGWKRAKVAS